MTGYKSLDLSLLLTEKEEDYTQSVLSSFSCPLSKDIEKFLHMSAIPFNKQGIAVTRLIYASYMQEWVLVGYYTLAYKNITISDRSILSKTMRKRLAKHGTYDKELKRTVIAIPLIAQLSKNYTNSYDKLIKGKELLALAFEKINILHAIAGGRYAYVECENEPKLIRFYEDNGFRVFSQRELDVDEAIDFKGKCLLQLIKHFEP